MTNTEADAADDGHENVGAATGYEPNALDGGSDSHDVTDDDDDAADLIATPHDKLDREREVLMTQLVEIEQGEESAGFDDNFADSGQVAAEQGENRVLAMQLREQLDDVERALGKLDDGTYGSCEVCAAAIGDPRLDAMPAARFCIDHAG